MVKTLEWRYHRPGWTSCKRTQEFLATHNISDGLVQSATKDPLEGSNALSVLENVNRMYVAKGRKVIKMDLSQDEAGESELLELLLGRSGKLRAPTIKVGESLMVGYSQEMFTSVLLWATLSRFYVYKVVDRARASSYHRGGCKGPINERYRCLSCSA